MKFVGRIHRFGDHINTDVIIPTKFLSQSDPEHLAKGCFSNVYPGFAGRVTAGDIVVAGENFGCGSSREHAPMAIKATGIACVVAASFSRIFYRSAINIGLPVVTSPEAAALAREGETAEVDLSKGTLRVGGRDFPIPQFPPQVLAIIEVGGLVPFMIERLKRQSNRGTAA
jgi:3-isopropylmalate dehydratase small subunit